MNIPNQTNADTPNETPVSLADRMIARRNVVAGVTGLGLAGLLGIGIAQAQDAEDEEPDLDLDDEEFEDEEFDGDPEIGEAYQNFLGKLTVNLGMTDSTEVDLAIRVSLKSMVDETFTAGEISQNDADAIKERIDSGVSPIGVAMFLGSRGRRLERRAERRNRRRDDDSDESTNPADDDLEDATPTA